MADVDSINEIESSDLDLDGDMKAIDADGESEEQFENSTEAYLKKKNKKKRRKFRPIERSSGDSENQASGDEGGVKSIVLDNEKNGNVENIMSGMEADSESIGAKSITDTAEVNAGIINLNNVGDSKASCSLNDISQLKKAVDMLTMKESGVAPKSLDDARQRKYHFWETQPVPKFDDVTNGNQEIEPDKSTNEIRSDPLTLPGEFFWDTLDIGDPLKLKELYTLLNENYVEDDDNMFRFDYSPGFLQWALQPPGWLQAWHCGLRVVKSKKLVGFISAIPADIKIHDRVKKMVEINFLCVHKKLRSKRVAPVLIKEITRRVHQQGVFQAVYTAGVVLPKPVASCRYWHRSLNPRKLIEVKFSHLSRNMTMQRTIKLYKLHDVFLPVHVYVTLCSNKLRALYYHYNRQPKTFGFRKLTPADVPDAYNLVTNYMQKFDLAPHFSEEEFRHWLIPRDNVVESFVVERNGEITDFASFYCLPSTIMHSSVHKGLRAAYSFYNVSGATPLVDLINDVLVVAKNIGYDVFNALDLMDNKDFLEKLKFGVGDGCLQYYLYNWKCADIHSHMVGLVLQ